MTQSSAVCFKFQIAQGHAALSRWLARSASMARAVCTLYSCRLKSREKVQATFMVWEHTVLLSPHRQVLRHHGHFQTSCNLHFKSSLQLIQLVLLPVGVSWSTSPTTCSHRHLAANTLSMPRRLCHSAEAYPCTDCTP